MSYREHVRIAGRVGCMPSTVRDFLEKRRKTSPVLAAAIRKAMEELAEADALTRAAEAPACPHEAEDAS